MSCEQGVAPRSNPSDQNESTHENANTIIFTQNADGYTSCGQPNEGGVLSDALYDTMMNENEDNHQRLWVMRVFWEI